MSKHLQYTWWKEAVGYQIYPKSFYDGNNDGIGDIVGIIAKIPYLAELGIDFLWICPFFDSPMDDNGYDISDYLAVHRLFGTMEDFKNLLTICQKYNIKILIDLVLNHTSDEHAWFKDAKSNPNSSYRDFYIIQPSNNTKPPTNWGSFFGGPAWEKLDNDNYYLKIFSKKMPDLNWANSKMRQSLYSIAKYWLDLGVAGFRIDAVAHIAKDTSYTNSTKEEINGIAYDWSRFSNLPDVQTYLAEFKKEILTPYDCFTIGEVGGAATSNDVLKYANYETGKLNLIFTFDHIFCNNIATATSEKELTTNIPLLKTTLENWQNELFNKAWLPLYLNNHDFNRVVSNYGNVNYHGKSAKALATMMYLMWGTIIIYQGEEIGMTNYPFKHINELQDVQTRGRYANTPDGEKERYLQTLFLSSRDNARTTMQWDSTHLGGFSCANNCSLLTNPNYETINVSAQLEDPDSILNYYKKIIKLKKTDPVFIYGSITFFHIDEKVISYKREHAGKKYFVVVNLSSDPIELTTPITFTEMIITNYPTLNKTQTLTTIEPYAAYVFQGADTSAHEANVSHNHVGA